MSTGRVTTADGRPGLARREPWSLAMHAAPWWLPGGNAQTIWPALAARRADRTVPALQRERWTTPDGDFIDVDFLASDRTAPGQPAHAADVPLLVLFHGLEGSSQSHYAQAFLGWAARHGWRCAVPHFRGCSGKINLAPRAYHSGDHEEIDWILARLRQRAGQRLHAVGVSLGGNALLRWAEEAGQSACSTVAAVCAISSPIDLTASGQAISRGFNRQIYTRMFLRSMKPKALAKLAQHPGLFDRERLLAARDLYAFDDVFTAPLHGFRNTADYWRRASAKPQLSRIEVPALVLNARNDPFVPHASLPEPASATRHVTLWQPAHGGHVGFTAGRFPGHVCGLPDAVMDWMRATQ